MKGPIMPRPLTSLAMTALAFAALAIGSSAGSVQSALLKIALNPHVHRQIVVDGTGRTLYVFTPNAKNTATCIDDRPAPGCTKVWRPLLADGVPRAGRDINVSKLRTTRRADGRIQVTYYGRPLYRFAGYGGRPADTRPGDANGQGLFELWHVLTPTGEPIVNGVAK